MTARRFPWFALVIALFVIAYPIFFVIDAATAVPSTDSMIQFDPWAIALAVALAFSPVYYGALALLIFVRETVLFCLKKTAKRRYLLCVSLFGGLIAAGVLLFLIV